VKSTAYADPNHIDEASETASVDKSVTKSTIPESKSNAKSKKTKKSKRSKQSAESKPGESNNMMPSDPFSEIVLSDESEEEDNFSVANAPRQKAKVRTLMI
jgi:hypothetical protein